MTKNYKIYNPTLDLIEEVLNEMKERDKTRSIEKLAEEDYKDRECIANFLLDRGELFLMDYDKGFEDLRFRAFLLALARKVTEDPEEQKKLARNAFAQFVTKGAIYVEEYDAWVGCFFPTAPGVNYLGSYEACVATEVLSASNLYDDKENNTLGMFHLIYDILDYWRIDPNLTFTYTYELFPNILG